MRFGSLAVFGMLVLAGCATPPEVDDEGFLVELPAELAPLAAAGQDLDRVRLMEDDCYWYRYVGPVETTLLPILTEDGRMICNQ